ncbi:hypothetical protein [Erythrobacter alti]|uniref:hypothetical protein n=1 Tax=Erythrobacter alti TaxID=1896145 RepID=UPI0030F3CB2F
MTSRFAFPAIVLPTALLLAACGGEAATDTKDGTREASGEVLKGSISDDMLPLDQVRSQAPLAEPEAGESGNGGSPVGSSADNERSGDIAEGESEPAVQADSEADAEDE